LDVRPFAEKTLPVYRTNERPKNPPSAEVTDGTNHFGLGDFAYCFERNTKSWRRMQLKWLVAWGLWVSTTGKHRPLQAFVCVESDYEGIPIPPPPERKAAQLRRRGWRFPPQFRDEGGTFSSFDKVCDARTLMRSDFASASVSWFKQGILEAAQILRAAKRKVKT
jgi:hypothetical protein